MFIISVAANTTINARGLGLLATETANLYCNHTVFLTVSLLCYVLFQKDPSTDFTFGLGQVVDEDRGSLPCDDSMELASKLNFTVITYLCV